MVKDEIKRQDFKATWGLLWTREQRLVLLKLGSLTRQKSFCNYVMHCLPNFRILFYYGAQKNSRVALREMAFVFQIRLGWLKIIWWWECHKAVLIHKYSLRVDPMHQSVDFYNKLALFDQEWVFNVKTNVPWSSVWLLKAIYFLGQECLLFFWGINVLKNLISHNESFSFHFKLFKLIKISWEYPIFRKEVVIIRKLLLNFREPW